MQISVKQIRKYILRFLPCQKTVHALNVGLFQLIDMELMKESSRDLDLWKIHLAFANTYEYQSDDLECNITTFVETINRLFPYL